jgi:hypothetical protein
LDSRAGLVFVEKRKFLAFDGNKKMFRDGTLSPVFVPAELAAMPPELIAMLHLLY